jgi:putative DNA primase/helicase
MSTRESSCPSVPPWPSALAPAPERVANRQEGALASVSGNGLAPWGETQKPKRPASRLSLAPKVSWPRRPMPPAELLAAVESLVHRHAEADFAQWFLFLNAEDICYVPQLKTWAMWDGHRWRIDDAKRIYEVAKDAVELIWESIGRLTDDDDRIALTKIAKHYGNRKTIENFVSLAQTDERVSKSINEFDQEGMFLNVRNGTIDLNDGRLLAHSRDMLQTKIIELDYEPNAACPMWEQFLSRIFRSHPELIHFIQKCIGYTLTGGTGEQKFFMCYGTGKNGKSTFIETILSILGIYALSSDPETWLRQPNGRRIASDLARLKGVRMVTCAEIDEGRSLDESRIKSISGGDTITVEQKYCEPFDIRPNCKLWISTNHAPQITGADEGIWRRVIVIPFLEKITEEECDDQLVVKLREERAGILSWAVQGCIDWNREGLRPPEIVLARTHEYREQEDTLGAFLAERCILDPSAKVQSSRLYGAYQEWAKAAGEKPWTDKRFAKRINECGFLVRTIRGLRYRDGLRLREPGDGAASPDEITVEAAEGLFRYAAETIVQ